jgi:hypothetical protein
MQHNLRMLLAAVVLAILGFAGAARADAAPARPTQEINEYSNTGSGSGGSGKTIEFQKQFKGAKDTTTLSDRVERYTSNTPLMIVVVGGVLVLGVWRFALR